LNNLLWAERFGLQKLLSQSQRENLLKKEEINNLIDEVEQKSYRIVEIAKRKREVNNRLSDIYALEKRNHRELLPAVSYEEISSLAFRVAYESEEYQNLQREHDTLDDESMLLTIELEKGRSIVLLEMIERSAEAFPLQLLSTKLNDFQ
jgi:hypothetical protein